MKKVPLSRGKAFALVDDGDFDNVMALGRWSLSNSGYAIHWYSDEQGRRRCIYLHRFIIAAPKHIQADHIDRDRLNNQRSNLRLVTRSENQWNKGRAINNTSGYKGVVRNKDGWDARITYHGQRIHLGHFKENEKLLAAKAYDYAAQQLFKQFRTVNEPTIRTPFHIEQRVLEKLKPYLN